MSESERAVERIMKLNRDMTKDAEFEDALRKELYSAYRRGFEKASQSNVLEVFDHDFNSRRRFR